MKIEMELRLQDALALNEMAKYDLEIDYDRYEVRRNVTDLIQVLLDREIAKFMSSEFCGQPNESGFSLAQMVRFLNAPAADANAAD